MLPQNIGFSFVPSGEITYIYSIHLSILFVCRDTTPVLAEKEPNYRADKNKG